MRPSDSTSLQAYVEIWRRSVDDLLALVGELPSPAWDAPTDLPGWSVHDIVAHVAHLEAISAGLPHDDAVDIGRQPHVRNRMGAFMEQGVLARRDRTPAELVSEIRMATSQRYAQLCDALPADPDAPADGPYGEMGWSWRTVLRNRPLDVFLHEQDIRWALGMPGNLASPAADHAINHLLDGLGYVVAKKVGAQAGTCVRVVVDGIEPACVRVDADGRGEPVRDPSVRADATIELTREAYLQLAAGRRRPAEDQVVVEGEHDLAARVMHHLATTP